MSQSRFRFIRCESPKDSLVVADLGRPAPVSLSSAIDASAEYVAAASATAGSLVLVNSSSTVSTLNIHTKAVSQLAFSHFDDSLLSCCFLGDSIVNFTRLSGSSISCTTKTDLSSIPTFTAWHPSCSSIFVACQSNNIDLLDVNRCSVLQSRAISNASVSAADFSSDGSLLSVASAIGSGSCGRIDIFDPRSSGLNPATIELPIRPHCIMNLKTESQLVVLGQDQFRNPCLVWFDTKMSNSVLLSETLQLSAGICISRYDPDTSLLYVSTRGSTNMMIFDLSRSNRLNHLTTYTSRTSFQGITSKPRRCLDIASSEVARIFQLTASSIETISCVVPRRTKEFVPELFPDAVSAEPSLTFEEYLQGKNAVPNTISLNPEQHVSDKLATNNPSQKQKAIEVQCVTDEADCNKSDNRRKLESLLKKNLVAHVSGQETRSLDSFWFGLKPSDVSMPLGLNMLANEKLIAVPWKSLGASSVGVISLGIKGRIEATTPLLRAHGQQMTCYALSDLDFGMMVTGCTDSHVRVWRFSPNRFELGQPDLSEPDIDISTPGKVTFVSLNPVSPSVLAVASQGTSSAILSLYDITSKESSKQAKLCIDCHPEAITSFSFSDDGHFIATMSRDRICRIFDPRRSANSPVVSFETQEGVRDTHIIWVGQTGCILSIGFGNASSRQISVWSALKSNQQTQEGGAQLLATHTIDNSNTTMVPKYDNDLGLLYIAGIGDRTILFFGIDLSKTGTELIEPLGRYVCTSAISGIAFLPKTMCSIANVEIGSALCLMEDQIRPISFTVPRKRKEYFQDDLFPDTDVVEGGMSASDWFNGKRFQLSSRCLQPQGMARLSDAPPEAMTGHQLRRLELLQAEKQQEAQPTVDEHIRKQLSNVETAAVVTNRWDAQPISDTAVAEDEWD